MLPAILGGLKALGPMLMKGVGAIKGAAPAASAASSNAGGLGGMFGSIGNFIKNNPNTIKNLGVGLGALTTKNPQMQQLLMTQLLNGLGPTQSTNLGSLPTASDGTI